MTKDKKNAPQELTDTDLDLASGGQNIGKLYHSDLNSKITTIHYDGDGNIARKVLLAEASGSGNVRGADPGNKGSYTFDEVIDGNFVPVTYKVD